MVSVDCSEDEFRLDESTPSCGCNLDDDVLSFMKLEVRKLFRASVLPVSMYMVLRSLCQSGKSGFKIADSETHR